MNDITIIIPVYNEEETIIKLLEEIKQIKINYKILVIDDNSNVNSSIIKSWSNNNFKYKD